MSGKSNVGTTLHLSASLPATYDVTAFDGITFTQIGGVLSVSEFGDTYSEAAYTLLETGRNIGTKGEVTGGTASTTYIPIAGDAGQDLLATAMGEDVDYSIKCVRSDGVIEYTIGRIFSNSPNAAEPTSVRQKTASIRINGEILEKPAA